MCLSSELGRLWLRLARLKLDHLRSWLLSFTRLKLEVQGELQGS